jgi:hypothetical protein
VQSGEVDFAGGQLAVPLNAELVTVNDIDDEYSAPRDMEFIVGLDRQLPGNMALSASYTYRRATRQVYTPYIGVNGTDWVACDPISSNGFTTQTCFDLGPGNLAALNANNGGVQLTNRPDYNRRYQGVELTLLKRLANKWSGRVAFGYNDWTEHFDGTAGIQDPNAAIYDTYGLTLFSSHIVTDAKIDGGQLGVFSTGSGTLYWVGGSKWQLSANALYQLPAGFEIAGNLYGRQGYLRPINITLDTLLGDTVLATPEVDSEHLPNVWNLDLRLAKNINVGSARVGLTADVFNVFNSNTTLRQTDAADAASLNRILQIMNPLIARFGVRVSF